MNDFRLAAWASLDLEQIEQAIWDLLQEGASNADSPYHTPTIGTAVNLNNSANVLPSLRTVILRRVDPEGRTISFYTDARTPKNREIEANSRVAWHFYDSQEKVQLRVDAKALIHYAGRGDLLAMRYWEATNLHARRSYCQSYKLGHEAVNDEHSLDLGNQDDLTAEEFEAGRKNFAVVEAQVIAFDWLYLRDQGNKQAFIRWKKNSNSVTGWLVP